MYLFKLGILLSLVIYSYSNDVCSVCGKYENVKTRIFNGAKSTYAPWAVFLVIQHSSKDGLQSTCSGSIIDFQHVLTSAHCFGSNLGLTPEEHAKYLQVNAGSLKKDGSLFVKLKPKKVYLHEKFSESNFSDPNASTLDDLAIVELAEPIKVSAKIRPICIGVNPETYDTMTVQGYGLLNCVDKDDNEENIQSKALMQTDLTLLPNEQCIRDYNKDEVLFTKKHLCASSGENGSTTCPGDSGGTVLVNQHVGDESRAFLVGLTSWGGPGDGQPNKPSVFTRVFSYLHWIQERTKVAPCLIEERIVMIYETDE